MRFLNNIKARRWIAQGKSNGTLSAAFIDCQHVDDKRISTFNTIAAFGDSLRSHAIPIHHFFLHLGMRDNLDRFQYKDRHTNPRLIPHPLLDFGIATPMEDEWVYPKRYSDGFKTPHSDYIINSAPDKGCVLLVAGFVSNDCIGRSMAGSFFKAINPEKHRVILASNATDNNKKAMRRAKSEMVKREATQDYLGHITQAPVADIMKFIRK